MSDKNLIGDTTYPHTPSLIKRWAIDPEWQHEDIEILEDDSGAWVTYKDHKDRIERLESELAEVQHDRVRYYWLQDWLESKVDSTEVFYQAKTRSAYNQAIDAAINGVNA